MPDEYIMMSEQEANELYFIIEGEISLIIDLNKRKYSKLILEKNKIS